MIYDGTSPYSHRRFDEAFVRQEIVDISAKAKRTPDLLLTDGSIKADFSEITVIDCLANRDAFENTDFSDLFVILAIDNDEVAAMAAKRVIVAGGKFIPVRMWGKASYFHTNMVWREAAHEEFLYQRENGFAKWDTLDFDILVQALERTAGIDGDYVEIGCFRGSSGSAVLAYLQAARRKMSCWFLDVFDGFQYAAAEESADALWFGTHKTEGQDVVAARLKRFQSDRLAINVERCNIIDMPLPEDIERIAVVNIDVDIYEGVYEALMKCAPLMAPGGVMFAEDVGHTPPLIGAKCAVEDFMKTDIAGKFIPFHIPHAQFAFFRSLDP